MTQCSASIQLVSWLNIHPESQPLSPSRWSHQYCPQGSILLHLPWPYLSEMYHPEYHLQPLWTISSWYVILPHNSAHGHISAVYSSWRPGVLSHTRLWLANRVSIDCSETCSFSIQNTHWCVSQLLHCLSWWLWMLSGVLGFTHDWAEMWCVSMHCSRSWCCGAWTDGILMMIWVWHACTTYMGTWSLLGIVTVYSKRKDSTIALFNRYCGAQLTLVRLCCYSLVVISMLIWTLSRRLDGSKSVFVTWVL